MYENSGYELHQKVRSTPRVPRVMLKSNSQHGLQNQDARSSWEPSSDLKSYGEICNNTVDHRISGVPLSAVEQQNTKRENKVKKLIEKFENLKHKESFIQDLRQTQKINKFSKESQDLIASSSAKNLITSSDPGKLIAAGKPASRKRRNSRPDEAPSSQVKLKDENLGGLMDDSAEKPVATEENQVLWKFSESESWRVHKDEVTSEPVAHEKGAGKPAASSISENSGNPKTERRKWPHSFYISSEVVSDMDKVYSIVRKTYDRGPTDDMEDLNMNAVMWGMFLNTTLQAAVHLGQDYDQNLRFVENHFWSSLKKLFKETEKLIKNQTEIIDLSTIHYGDYTWSATSFCVTEFFRSRMPRPTSSPTWCSVWERTRTRLGRRKLSGILRMII